MVKKRKKAKAKRKVVRRKSARKTVTRKKKTKRAGGKRKSGLTQMTYACSPELQAIGCGRRETRPGVVKKLWHYIKAHKCQDTRNKRMINPDKKLSEVLGSRPLDMLKLAGHISKHLSK